MKINKALNLVVPVEFESGDVYYVHSTPIRKETFEKYFLVIAKAFAKIYQDGLNVVAGPRVAMLMLRRIAEEDGVWEGSEGVEMGLVNEIRRLSNVIMPSEDGSWGTIPLQDALNRGLLSDEDISEVEGMIAFFICASAMHKRNQVEGFLQTACNLWSSQLSLLTCTEFAKQLPTSTEEGNSGETATISSVPS